MADIPRWRAGELDEPVDPEDVPNIEKVFERLPVTLYVGDPRERGNMVIGWSNAFRDKDTGETTIVMTLDGEASKGMGDLVEVFKLYAIGFAGVARRPHERSRRDGAGSGVDQDSRADQQPDGGDPSGG